MANKSTDLTILLKAVDKTKGVFDKLEKRLGKFGGLVGKLGKFFSNLGKVIVGVFLAGVANGKMFFDELTRMSALIGTNTQEASALFEVFKSQNALTNIDHLSDGLLTLKERFSEARVGTGELFNFAKDFGLVVNTEITGMNSQTLEFLNMLKQLPDAGDRVATAIAIMGQTGAEQFIPMLQTMEDLNALTESLSQNIKDTPNFISDGKIKATTDYKKSLNDLNDSWRIFSVEIFALVAPALNFINRAMAGFLDWTTKGVRALGEFFGVFDDNALIPATSIEGLGDQIEDVTGKLSMVSSEYQESLDKISTANNRQANNLRKTARGQKDDIAVFSAQLVDLEIRLSALKKLEERGSGKKPGAVSNFDVPGNGEKSGIVITALGVFESQKAHQSAIDAIEFKRIKEQVAFEKLVEDTQQFRLDNAGDLAEISNPGGAANDRFNRAVPVVEMPATDEEKLTEQIAGHTQKYAEMGDAITSVNAAIAGLGSISGKSTGEAFKNYQRLQIALSSAAAIAAQIQVLASPDTPTFFGKLAAYAKIGAVAFGAIGKLRKLNVGSPATSPAGTSGGSAAPTGAIGGQAPNIPTNERPQRDVTVNIRGNGNISAENIEEFIDTLNDTDTGRRINANRLAA